MLATAFVSAGVSLAGKNASSTEAFGDPNAVLVPVKCHDELHAIFLGYFFVCLSRKYSPRYCNTSEVLAQISQ